MNPHAQAKTTATTTLSDRRPLLLFPPVHLVGIGGSGMSSLAEILLDLNLPITGCDGVFSSRIRTLEDRGVRIWIGHNAEEHLPGIGTVVHTAAVPRSHPELRAARERGIPVFPRSLILARLSRMLPTACVAGTHGKSTVTALATHILASAGRAPGYAIGSVLLSENRGGAVGAGKLLIMETDEFDRTLDRVSPHLAVITNVEAEHMDVYGGLDGLKSAFSCFAKRALDQKGVITWVEGRIGFDPASLSSAGVLRCGLAPSCDVWGEVVSTSEPRPSVRITLPDNRSVETDLRLHGEHNLANAILAAAIAFLEEVKPEEIARGLSTFPGIERRFERLGQVGESLLISDYAHHPTEVAAALGAAKALGNPVVAVFQPHLYSRTARLFQEFGRALSVADQVMVTAIYPAREEPRPGVTGRLISDAVAAGTPAEYLPTFGDLKIRLRSLLGKKLTVIFLSAGDLDAFARTLTA